MQSRPVDSFQIAFNANDGMRVNTYSRDRPLSTIIVYSDWWHGGLRDSGLESYSQLLYEFAVSSANS